MSDDRRIFTYEEALSLLPHVHELTSAAVRLVEELLGDDAETEEDGSYDVPSELVGEFRDLINAWAGSITDLGIEVKGLWLIDFDSGSGYYCWRYPEPSLQYFHGYEEGFGGRVQLN